MGSIHPDVLLTIFSQMSYVEVVRCSFVCKAWNKVANDHRLWVTSSERGTYFVVFRVLTDVFFSFNHTTKSLILTRSNERTPPAKNGSCFETTRKKSSYFKGFFFSLRRDFSWLKKQVNSSLSRLLPLHTSLHDAVALLSLIISIILCSIRVENVFEVKYTYLLIPALLSFAFWTMKGFLLFIIFKISSIFCTYSFQTTSRAFENDERFDCCFFIQVKALRAT